MERLIKNDTCNLHPVELASMTETKKETIFNPTKFQSIYNRVLNIKPGSHRRWGKMNLVQMLNHLKLATGSGLKIYKLKDESSLLSRGLIKFLILSVFGRLPKNAGAPNGFRVEMNNDLDFDIEKEQVLKMLKKAYASMYDVYPHPLFGNMTRTEWGKLVYRHFDHHLRQFGS